MKCLVPLACLALSACGGNDTPEVPDEAAQEKLRSIEERLDAAETADPTPPESDEKGPDAEAPDPHSSD